MADYIEREAAISLLKRYLNAPHVQGGFTIGQGMRIAINSCIELMGSVPAADVVPVRHGRWDDSFDGITPYCSVCGRSHRGMVRMPNYCPHCGAKLDLCVIDEDDLGAKNETAD